jgi:thioredoxin-like negative regulator of GroEL
MWYPRSFFIRLIAVNVVAAFVLCFLTAPNTTAAILAEKKARSQAEKALREGDFELAEKLFRELLSKNGKDNDARLGLSFALLKQRRLQDAYDHAARVILADPISAKASKMKLSQLPDWQWLIFTKTVWTYVFAVYAEQSA